MAYCLLLTICVSPDHPYKNKIPLDCDPGPVWSEASSVSRCEGGEAGETRGASRAGPGTRRLGLSQTGTLRHSAHGARVAIEGYFSRVAIDAYFTLGVTETGDSFFL